MITRLKCITNSKVNISYVFEQDVVMVQSVIPGQLTYVSGMPNLKERFDELYNNLSENIDFETAVKYFFTSDATQIISNL